MQVVAVAVAKVLLFNASIMIQNAALLNEEQRFFLKDYLMQIAKQRGFPKHFFTDICYTL